MPPQRPELSQLPEDVRAYIEYLEDALNDAQSEPSGGRSASVAEPSEAPTTQMVVTITRDGMIKRTPRHLYGRQRRGGMGVFDIESSEDDPPALLAVGDVQDRLIFFTDRSRFFSLRISEVAEGQVRARGETLSRWLPLQPGEKVVLALPEQNAAYFYLLSDRGWVRRVVGTQLLRLAPGSVLEARQGHRPVAACWGTGDRDLLIVTRGGQGIRFEERLVPIQGGCLGIRLDGGDEALSIANVNEKSGVFVLGEDGKGTIRQMSGVRANKSPGAGGKTIMKADRIIDAHAVAAGEDVFVISQLSKLIRFAADEVPPKEGVVQGVNCMALRADEAVACAVSDAGEPLAE
ncbi:MAG: DNA gyrase C-terminal beta-propeller domain-containing protein [Caldilineaceae bacterium]